MRTMTRSLVLRLLIDKQVGSRCVFALTPLKKKKNQPVGAAEIHENP